MVVHVVGGVSHLGELLELPLELVVVDVLINVTNTRSSQDFLDLVPGHSGLADVSDAADDVVPVPPPHLLAARLDAVPQRRPHRGVLVHRLPDAGHAGRAGQTHTPGRGGAAPEHSRGQNRGLACPWPPWNSFFIYSNRFPVIQFVSQSNTKTKGWYFIHTESIKSLQNITILEDIIIHCVNKVI